MHTKCFFGYHDFGDAYNYSERITLKHKDSSMIDTFVMLCTMG